MDNKRRRARFKAVLPVKLLGIDGAGRQFCELSHTLDITDTGVRLGSIQRAFKVGTRLTLQYKQHRAEFKVVWVVRLKHLKEHQIGLEALVQRDLWGLAAEPKVRLLMTVPESTPQQPEA